MAARPTIAIPFDEAFYRYFPDTLDLLEARGARVRHFSPLRDEALPVGTGHVFLGCGRPESFASRLAGNHCMLNALRKYIAAGGRVYAEGGGAAYLCQRVVLADGRDFPMVGALPTTARQMDPPAVWSRTATFLGSWLRCCTADGAPPPPGSMRV